MRDELTKAGSEGRGGQPPAPGTAPAYETEIMNSGDSYANLHLSANLTALAAGSFNCKRQRRTYDFKDSCANRRFKSVT